MMSEEQVEMPVEEDVQTTTEEAAGEEVTSANIGDELQNLGRNLAAATKAVFESPEAKELGAQLQHGLESLEKSVHQMMTHARESKVGRQVESGVSEAATTVKERGVLETLSESVSGALHTVNVSIEQAVEKAHARAEEAEAEKSGPQQIEVVEAEEELPAEPEASEE
jgi:hypothetical protein